MEKEIYEWFLEHLGVFENTLISIDESLKSIDQSLKKIAGGNSEKIPGRVKKSYSERYFTYSGEKDK